MTLLSAVEAVTCAVACPHQDEPFTHKLAVHLCMLSMLDLV